MENRRKFLRKIGIGTASIGVYKTSILNGSHYKHLHVKETNFTLSAISPSFIGFLYTDFPMVVEEKINKIRIKHHYRGTLSFRSTDKYKFPFAKDLIDYFFNEPSLYFYARAINGTYDLKENNINDIHDIIYRVNYKKAISDLRSATKSDKFYLDFINYLGRKSNSLVVPKSAVPYVNFKTNKNQLVRYLNTNIPYVNLKLEQYKFNNLSQLADFLTGNIWGDEIGIENKTKKQLLSYLKKRLNVEKLNELYNMSQNKKFIISSNHK